MSSVDYEMRRSFYVKDGELTFCPKRNVSNIDWMVRELGMTEEEFANTVHGAYYPGRAYFYKGINDTHTDDEVRKAAESCRHLFNKDTEICCGAIPGVKGEKWEPVECIGYGTSAGVTHEKCS